MSLFDELNAESAPAKRPSIVEDFLNTMDPQDLADLKAFIAGGGSVRGAYRVLKRRGLQAADSTFRNWVIDNWAPECR